MIPALVAELYGVAVREARLLPGGYHASSYVLDDAYVLKFFAERPSVELLVSLAAAGLPVAAPVASASGDLAPALADGRFVVLFPFIAGATPPAWPRWPASVLRSLGVVLRRVHSLRLPGSVSQAGLATDPRPAATGPRPVATGPVGSAGPVGPGGSMGSAGGGWTVPVDDLDIPFAARLSAVLEDPSLPDRLRTTASGAVGGGNAMRDEIAGQLRRLRSLQAAARATRWERVLCHTDVGGDNILVTPSGGVSLLDWDEAVLGPPENDFILFARDQPPDGWVLATVLDGYGGSVDPDRMAFCGLRRYLGDATVRLERLLDPACADPDAVRADLVAWGVRPWRALRTGR